MGAAGPATARLRRAWLDALQEGGPSERRILGDARLRTLSGVEWLYGEAIRLVRVDVSRAAQLARATRLLAARVGDPRGWALALRAEGHIAFARGRYEGARVAFVAANRLFRRLGLDLEVALTRSAALQTLIYLGRYQQAFSWARRARDVFERGGDRLRLARLDLNVANILYRQDRFEEALTLYRASLQEFRLRGKPQDVAVALRNRAVCEISRNDFKAALRTYREARSFCERHRLPLLVAEVDYNIAYLFYLRGEYTRAIELYEDARRLAARLGDRYHEALCDLDQSEMFLELNLVERGRALAERALRRFEALGMRYEAAKALLFLAVAARHDRDASRSLALFSRARKLFVKEKNRLWPSLIPLYQAVVLFEIGDLRRARRLSETALAFFARTALSGKAALCDLLLARIDLRTGHPARAWASARRALRRLEGADAPTSIYQAFYVAGQVLEARGQRLEAARLYRRARARLEGLRGHLEGEELKIAFFEDKLGIYEALVRLSLRGRPDASRRAAAFSYVEEAKSRSLADLIAFRAHLLPGTGARRGRAVRSVQRLREELNWTQRRLRALQEEDESRFRGTVRALRRRAALTERNLTVVLRATGRGQEEFRALQNAGTLRLGAIRETLAPGTTILEYMRLGDRFVACVLDRRSLTFVPVGGVAAVREHFELLKFQLSKLRLGAAYVRTFGTALEAATHAHLRALHDLLVAPARARLTGSHVVVVPHGFLHYLPFHALHDGTAYLADALAVSYAPSASVYALCVTKPARSRNESLVLGLPDAATPHILGEVRAVAATLPNARLFLGARATRERLEEHGSTARYVHIAAHGLFRQDNPMFSSIRLGGSELSLFDLYQLQLSAELVTLSGCGTGLNVIVGGDELLGLVRGLLYAGAHSVLGTLWDVNDETTALFMKTFYERLRTTSDRAEAVRLAMRRLRETHPHPYHWAPFVLTGGVGGPGDPKRNLAVPYIFGPD
jgi:tetratricopeptide (TPR) repeat protein